MISFLRGMVVGVSDDAMVLEVNGMGLRVLMSTALAQGRFVIGREAKVYTFLHVREGELQLFGFLEEPQLRLFEQLISVTGVGPRTAAAAVWTSSSQSLYRAVVSGDTNFLTSLPGIGKKTAERIIFELKGKLRLGGGTTLEVGPSGPEQGPLEEARAALEALGYKAEEVGSFLQEVPSDLLLEGPEAIIRHVLQKLA